MKTIFFLEGTSNLKSWYDEGSSGHEDNQKRNDGIAARCGGGPGLLQKIPQHCSEQGGTCCESYVFNIIIFKIIFWLKPQFWNWRRSKNFSFFHFLFISVLFIFVPLNLRVANLKDNNARSLMIFNIEQTATKCLVIWRSPPMLDNTWAHSKAQSTARPSPNTQSLS